MRTCFSWCLVVLLVFGALVGSSAAQDGGGGGGFWEKMSGPGRWSYGTAYYRYCLKGTKTTVEVDGKKREVCTLNNADAWLNLGGSYATTGDENRPNELVSPDMRALSFEPSMDYRIPFEKWVDWKWLLNRPVLAGGGPGVHWFWGEDVFFTKASLEWRVSFTLLQRQGTSVGFRYGWRYFLGGFSADDFGYPAGNFDTGSVDGVETIAFYVTLGY